MNAPFVLFVMSSLVLGLLTFAYQEYSAYQKARDADARKLAHLRSEVLFRVTALREITTEGSFGYTAMWTANGALVGEDGNQNAQGQPIGDYRAIYPELGRRSIASLLWEIQELSVKTRARVSVNEGLVVAHRLKKLWNESLSAVHDQTEDGHESRWRFDEPSQRERFVQLTADLERYARD